MIVSVSRRTDIPAFYSRWFMNRIAAGFVDAMNPFNRKQITRINLSPKEIDCFVFWTKDAGPMLPYLEQLDTLGYKYYFQFTITPYGRDIEPGLRDKDQLIDTFQRLSEHVGTNRVVWRYDPILLTPKYSIQQHISDFADMAQKLAPYTDTCVISFLDLYRKTERNTSHLGLQPLTTEAMQELASALSDIARKNHLSIQSCSEEIDLSAYGLEHGACIDHRHVAAAMNCKIDLDKDNTQRAACGCAKSIDIGQYNTCLHLCSYCYANFNVPMTKARQQQHDENSSLLTGNLIGDEKITPCHLKPIKRHPLYEPSTSLF